MLEHSLIERGECPDKQYVNQLLSDVDTRLAIFDYENVEPDTKLDVKKMNEDLKLIKKDLDILYEIVTELSGQMYRELESYVNGYLGHEGARRPRSNISGSKSSLLQRQHARDIV